MDKLPLEILGIIFASLPMVSQLQVCKTWRDLLPKPKVGLLYGVSSHDENTIATEAEFYFSVEKSDKIFSTSKLDHNLIMSSCVYRSFMVGSCNGLVCYASHHGSITNQWRTKVYICNPITGEHFQLPSIEWFDSKTTIGFGYVRSTNEYKVVSVQCGFSFHPGKFQVYTLRGGGGGRWKNKSSMIEKGFMSHFIGEPSAAVFTSGALHWMDLDSFKPNPVAFDLENETFELLPSIPSDARVAKAASAANHVGLMELGGSLCAIEIIPSKRITVWELIRKRKIYWGRKLTILWKDYSWFKPLGVSKRDKCLVYCNAILSCYDPETGNLRKLEETLKKFKDANVVYTRSRLTPHVNSLVSLKELTEKRGGRKRKAPEETQKEKLTATG